MKKIFWFNLNLVCCLMIATESCYAYIDPATTSYVVQIVAGIVIACGATAGIFWNKFVRKVKKRKMDNIKELKMEDSASLDGKSVVTAEDLLDDEEV